MVTHSIWVNGLLYALAHFYTKVLQTCSGLMTLHQQIPAAAFKATQLPSEAKSIPHNSFKLFHSRHSSSRAVKAIPYGTCTLVA